MTEQDKIKRVKLFVGVGFLVLIGIFVAPGWFSSATSSAQKVIAPAPVPEATPDPIVTDPGASVDPEIPREEYDENERIPCDAGDPACVDEVPDPTAVVFPEARAVQRQNDIQAASKAEAGLNAALPFTPRTLSQVTVPEPDNLADFVRDKDAAIALGKALFWDIQAASDGKIACASCHFHAGADSRSVNTLAPGGPGVTNNIFTHGPNYQSKVSDYPHHKLSNPDDRNSTVLYDTDDITGSAGVFRNSFGGLIPNSPQEIMNYISDPVFRTAQGHNVRRVTGRNTPSSINAVFNFRNFWDGRAQEDFNGMNPFGSRDPHAKVFRADTTVSGTMVTVSLNKASLASQAVGPPSGVNPAVTTVGCAPGPNAGGNIEMSSECRHFPNIGRKLVYGLRPLQQQQVATNDSVLGSRSCWGQPVSVACPNTNGLNASYLALIQQAFQPKWWQNTTHRMRPIAAAPYWQLVTPGTSTDFKQIEYNFSLFFGVAIQLYEATLRSDQTPFDQYMAGNRNAMTVNQVRGLLYFVGEEAKCSNCHGGVEFTNASYRNVKSDKIERMVMGNGGVAVYDNGFYNIGVRPTTEDLGVGDKDPWNNPLSFSKYFQITSPGIWVNGVSSPYGGLGGPLDPNERTAVNGAFKVPGLRNVALTAPYFHNGGQLTLSQVVDFYNRGGDFHNQNIQDLDPDIENLRLARWKRVALVAFLRALTDERVRRHRAPFDHPSLPLVKGHPISNPGPQYAQDLIVTLPKVGAGGYGAALNNFPAYPR